MDTVSDFLAYLKAKEAYLLEGGHVIFEGHEEDLLATYIKFGRSFPEEPDLLVIGENLWGSLTNFTEYQAKKREDRISYLWDAIIEAHIEGIADGHAIASPGLLESEPALRILALEDRYWRRVLSKALMDFLSLAKKQKIRSRIAISVEKNTAYVFLPASIEEDPQERLAELTARSWVALDKVRKQDIETVVGIALGELKPGHPLDLLYINKPIWTKQDQKKAKEAREELGFFLDPIEKRFHEDEYPLN